MRHLLILIRHEVRVLLVSAATYTAAVLAVTMMGFLYFIMLMIAMEGPQDQRPPELFFSFFWIPVLLIVPMLTMRSVAEERRLGTLETMMTTPITAFELVLAKFVAAYGFYLLIWGASLAFPLLTAWGLAQPHMTELLLDRGTLKGGYTFIALSGLLFIAVGIFSSSLTRSQLVAGMLSFSILFILMVGATALNFLESNFGHNQFRGMELVQYLQVFQHFEDFVRGTLDTRPIVYYLTGTALVLGLAGYNVEAKA